MLLRLTIGVSHIGTVVRYSIRFESISLNQIELRNLKETVLAVSQKDRKQRDRMLDYLEKRIERDDKQIRGT
jgi:hypothetical protein